MKNKGFTFIELIIVIVLTSILASIGSRVLLAGFTAYSAHKNMMSANNQARMAMERMTRDIHVVLSAASITTATSSQFSFTNISGTNITYYLQSTPNASCLQGYCLMRNAPNAQVLDAQVLADNVSSLSFSYLDKNAATIPVPVTGTAMSNIRYVNVNFLISLGRAQYTMRTTIYTMNYH